jgi:transcriptional regulator with XRE-family HTH domain
MAKKFQELFDKMPAGSRKRVRERAERLRAEMPLAKLREARQMTQVSLAETLNVGQAAVSRIETRTDAYVSTLRRYIEAVGGTLVILARFPEGEVRITQFEEIAEGSKESVVTR